MSGSDSQSDPGRFVSQDQLSALLDFLEVHRELAIGYSTGLTGRASTKEGWARLARYLNDLPGSRKTPRNWAKYWSSYKNRCRAKIRKIKIAATGTGGGPASKIKLTTTEERVQRLLGPLFGGSIPHVQVPLFIDETPQSVETQETFDSLIFNDDDTTRSEPEYQDSPTFTEAAITMSGESQSQEDEAPRNTEMENPDLLEPWNRPGPSWAPHVPPRGAISDSGAREPGAVGTMRSALSDAALRRHPRVNNDGTRGTGITDHLGTPGSYRRNTAPSPVPSRVVSPNAGPSPPRRSRENPAPSALQRAQSDITPMEERRNSGAREPGAVGTMRSALSDAALRRHPRVNNDGTRGTRNTGHLPMGTPGSHRRNTSPSPVPARVASPNAGPSPPRRRRAHPAPSALERAQAAILQAEERRAANDATLGQAVLRVAHNMELLIASQEAQNARFAEQARRRDEQFQRHQEALLRLLNIIEGRICGRREQEEN